MRLISTVQQFTGYYEHANGSPWQDLISSMGLTQDEFDEIEKQEMLEWMRSKDKIEIQKALSAIS
jgi:hypothetical protein